MKFLKVLMEYVFHLKLYVFIFHGFTSLPKTFFFQFSSCFWFPFLFAHMVTQFPRLAGSLGPREVTTEGNYITDRDLKRTQGTLQHTSHGKLRKALLVIDKVPRNNPSWILPRLLFIQYGLMSTGVKKKLVCGK